jgi:hypothetical protein
MTYLKCTSCKAGLYSVARSDDLRGELCPGCGAMVEPVGELGGALGYRSIELRADPAVRQAGHGAQSACVYKPAWTSLRRP